MSLNPGGAGNYGWNYSKPDKPDYSTQLVGTVLAIQEVQKMSFTMNGQPGAPEFWPDGNPKMNIRLALATESGEIKTFTFQPASRAARMGQKKSVHMDLFHLTGDTDMMNLIGKTLCIQTQEGFYGQGHPRPWFVSIVEGGPYEPAGGLPSEFKAPRVLANAAVSGGQMNAPQQQPVYQQQYQQPQQQYQQPMQQQAYQPQGMAQAYQPMQQPAQQPQMDPNIMAAMKQMGVTNYEVIPAEQSQPVGTGQQYGDMYENDPDMPF